MIFLLLLFSCSQVNIHENEDVCYLHVYVELPEGYQDWTIGFIQFLQEYTQEERKKMSSYNLGNIDGVERFKAYSVKRVVPHYENLILINKESFVLIKDTIHFRLRGYECFLGWPTFGDLEDFLIYKQGDTIFKHYDLSDKECVPLPYE